MWKWTRPAFVGLFTCLGALSVWQPFNSTRPVSQVPSFESSSILLGAIITIHALPVLLWRGHGESGNRDTESPGDTSSSCLKTATCTVAWGCSLESIKPVSMQYMEYFTIARQHTHVIIWKRRRRLSHAPGGNIHSTWHVLWKVPVSFKVHKQLVKWSTSGVKHIQREGEERGSMKPNRCFSNFRVFIA